MNVEDQGPTGLLLPWLKKKSCYMFILFRICLAYHAPPLSGRVVTRVDRRLAFPALFLSSTRPGLFGSAYHTRGWSSGVDVSEIGADASAATSSTVAGAPLLSLFLAITSPIFSSISGDSSGWPRARRISRCWRLNSCTGNIMEATLCFLALLAASSA